MKYDDASWHYDGDFPAESPYEYGATHMGLFLRWNFARGFVGEIYQEEVYQADVEKVISGELSGADFLLHWCDGKLTDEEFDDRGNAFAEQYYEDYLDDYEDLFPDLVYVAPETEHDFRKLSEMLDQEYERFTSNASESKAQIETPKSGAKKPWWKFW